ncbi:MAG: NACHT domain-containing protein [Microcoleaceae cyanobacterium]
MSRSISPRRQLAHRSHLLKQVKREIKQFRLQSLHRAVLTKLAEETPPLKMRRTWDIEAKVGKHKSVKLSADSGVIPVFDRISGKLLILGATGAGKTTTLMGLAKVLVSRALQDEAEPIPVLLNLRSWHPGMPAIAHWIIEQLKWKYNISSEVSSYWLDQLQILPLLDGLNEVSSEYRELCIQQINQWLKSDVAPIHLVVCSTVDGYYRCKKRLELNGAILLKPLTKTQIREYLFHAQTRALWNEIETNENLLKLAQKPLFLTLMTLAHDEILLESWKRLSSEDEQLHYLFNAYIRRQVAQHREGIEYHSAYPADQMRQGLEWIAQRLEEENKIEFSVDEIPVNWLREAEEERSYTWGTKFLKGIIWWSIIALIIIAIAIQSIEMMLLIAGIGFIWAFISEILSINSLIEQFILRRIMSSKGYLPLKYKQFLEDAKQRLILQQVGDRYRFIHHWLQQYFAQLRI